MSIHKIRAARSLHATARGHIPLFNGDAGWPEAGWLRVGPALNTEPEILPMDDYEGEYKTVKLAVHFSEVDASEKNYARVFNGIDSKRGIELWSKGEFPIRFMGCVAIGSREYGVQGLHYRSGLYRGWVVMPDVRVISELPDLER